MYANEEQIEFGVPSRQLSYQHQLLQQRKGTAIGPLILQCRFITTSALIIAALADTKARALSFIRLPFSGGGPALVRLH